MLKQVGTYNQREVRILLDIIPSHLWPKLTIAFLHIYSHGNLFFYIFQWALRVSRHNTFSKMNDACQLPLLHNPSY